MNIIIVVKWKFLIGLDYYVVVFIFDDFDQFLAQNGQFIEL
jgi:hypothetical protein